MKNLFTLMFCCLMTLMSYSQKTKTLQTFGNPTAFEITSTIVKCGTSTYQSIGLTNLTNDVITVSFDVESYWSNNPTKPTEGDNIYTYIINPNKTVTGNCVDNTLLFWSSGPMTDIELTNLKITNLVFTTN